MLLRREALGKHGKVLLCSVSDAYQPIESRYNLTRRVLEALPGNFHITILTKSPLILRDVDLFPKFRSAELGLTITTMDSSIAGVFEPRAPAPRARLNALEKLHDEGLNTYAFIGPILPGLTELEEMVSEIAPYTNKILFEDLNMGPARREIMAAVRENYPELENLYKNLNSQYWQKVAKEINELARKYRFTAEIYFKHTGTLKF
jgi:DNA repair photolyase